jgi:hypothetical protein
MRIFNLLIILFSFSFSFVISVGGFSVCPSKNGASYQNTCDFTKRKPIFSFLKRELPNVNGFSIWITKGWEKSWYPSHTINKAIKNGYIPIFIFYWFGDDISKKYVQKHKKEYLKDLKRFSNFLTEIKGPKFIILNPEYNENGMNNSKQFDILQAKSILLIKEKNPKAKVGICLGDFGNYNLLWDRYNWDLNLPSLNYSAKLSDFIAFQEMRALTRNTKEQILNTPLRALAFATYLHQKFKKPTFLAYLAISSFKNENLQKQVIKDFVRLMPLFKNGANLIGINIFHYIDVPTHKGYFKEAEKFFGLKKANGEKKPSFYEFKKIK